MKKRRPVGLNPRSLGESPRQRRKRQQVRDELKRAGRVEPFYLTEEWRALRYSVLRQSDGCCTLCGRSKPIHGVTLHVDHIKPRSRYPELELTRSNLQVLCEDCNLGKSNGDETDWRRIR